jgi:hypothetical protein
MNPNHDPKNGEFTSSSGGGGRSNDAAAARAHSRWKTAAKVAAGVAVAGGVAVIGVKLRNNNINAHIDRHISALAERAAQDKQMREHYQRMADAYNAKMASYPKTGTTVPPKPRKAEDYHFKHPLKSVADKIVKLRAKANDPAVTPSERKAFHAKADKLRAEFKAHMRSRG